MKRLIVLFLVFSIMSGLKAITPAKRAVFNEMQRKSVEKLYKKWYSGPLRGALMKRSRPSKFAGSWAKSNKSKWYIPRFIKKYEIDMNEALLPASAYTSFNDFFIRKLHPEARPMPIDSSAIISPADGSVVVLENITGTTQYPIKGATFTTEKILNNLELAEKFMGGTAFVVRLAPWDYHRFHFPLSGVAGFPQRVKGRYETVSPTAFQRGIQPLEVNERHIITFQPDRGHTMAIALVGALFVGSIVETYKPHNFVQRGDEMGYYEFGGSTMVLFFQKDTITVRSDIVSDSAEGKETPVKMGETIAHVVEGR